MTQIALIFSFICVNLRPIPIPLEIFAECV
jgi:hypothetical protein